MDIKIEGNPGTGNSYTEVHQEFHINHVENLNPNATTVTDYYGSGARAKAEAAAPVATPSDLEAQRERQRQEILDYVNKLLREAVAPEYVTTYDDLWRDILALPEVAAEVYNPGKQQRTAFNRNLVANIICMMKDAGIIREQNVSRLTQLLEGEKDHSVRAALSTPPARVIYNKVRARIEKQ